jgi:signal transduction histidine kinase/CheY-like chemotaxis protein
MKWTPSVGFLNSARARLGLFMTTAFFCFLITLDQGCRLGFFAKDPMVWTIVVTAIAGMGVLFMVLLFSFLARTIFAPLLNVAEEIKHATEGKYKPSVVSDAELARKDEFGLLVQSVNEMAMNLSARTQELHVEKKYQEALLASIPDCVCLFDQEARLTKVYKQPDLVLPLRGLNVGEPLNEPFFLGPDGKQLQLAIQKTFANGKPQLAFISMRETADMFRHFEVKACKINDQEALVVFRDISRDKRENEFKKQAEGHLVRVEKIESLGTLAAGIAHDVNSMLTVIRNTLEVTWQNPLQSEIQAIKTILQAAEKGTQLTHELMTYAGQNQLKFQRTDPNQLVLAMEKLLQGVMASNVILELNLGRELPKVDADPHQFWKVLLNLLKNASEAMNGMRGAVRISTYTFSLSEENRHDFFCTHSLTNEPGVVIEISDTGIGIPKEILKRIFEPFFSTKSTGRGLGLATAFGIVDAHNGAIALSSEVGKGTTFRIWLPLSKAAVSEAVAEKEQPAVGGATAKILPPGRRPCVMVIEDDRAVLQTTRILLNSMGIDSLEATSKRDAVGVFRKNMERISLILLDATIENMDNVKLLSLLREYKPDVPIVVVSGYSEKRIRELFEAHGYEGFLGKPYTRDQLVQALRPFITMP